MIFNYWFGYNIYDLLFKYFLFIFLMWMWNIKVTNINYFQHLDIFNTLFHALYGILNYVGLITVNLDQSWRFNWQDILKTKLCKLLLTCLISHCYLSIKMNISLLCIWLTFHFKLRKHNVKCYLFSSKPKDIYSYILQICTNMTVKNNLSK